MRDPSQKVTRSEIMEIMVTVNSIHGVETPTPVDTIAKTWSSARQSTIARLQSRPCDSGGPATNRPAPPAHGTTCRPSRWCSRAAVLAGDQRGQRLTGSSTAGCRCEMNHSAHPLALSNHFPPPTDCPGSIRPSSSVKPRGAIHVRTLAPRAHTDVGATGDLPARTARTRCLPASQVFHLDRVRGLSTERPFSATWAARMQPRPIALWGPVRAAALHSCLGRAEEAKLAAQVLVWAWILAPDGCCSGCCRESGWSPHEVSCNARVTDV